VTAAAAVAEVNTIVGVGTTLPTSVKNGDVFVIDNGVGNTVTVNITADDAAFTMAKLVTGLGTATNVGSFISAGAAVGTWSASGNNLLYTRATAGTATDFTLSKLKYQPVNQQVGTVSTTNGGTALNAVNAHTTAATTSNVGTASNTRAGSSATGSNVVNASKATVTLAEAKSISIGADARSAAFTTFVGANAGGVYTIGGTDGANFTVNASTGEITNIGNMDYETDTSHTVDLIYTAASGAKFTETFTLNLTDVAGDNGSYVADIDMSTQQGANDAIEILDFAINQISASQAKLGAIQNRLQHNIDNLSMAAMVTETAKGRITDADYARETSELSKQQILSQAATSMLAQANQSKQGVLALLQ
jgi:flagellin-like hook-associated protein FlgL